MVLINRENRELIQKNASVVSENIRLKRVLDRILLGINNCNKVTLRPENVIVDNYDQKKLNVESIITIPGLDEFNNGNKDIQLYEIDVNKIRVIREEEKFINSNTDENGIGYQSINDSVIGINTIKLVVNVNNSNIDSNNSDIAEKFSYFSL